MPISPLIHSKFPLSTSNQDPGRSQFWGKKMKNKIIISWGSQQKNLLIDIGIFKQLAPLQMPNDSLLSSKLQLRLLNNVKQDKFLKKCFKGPSCFLELFDNHLTCIRVLEQFGWWGPLYHYHSKRTHTRGWDQIWAGAGCPGNIHRNQGIPPGHPLLLSPTKHNNLNIFLMQ